MREDFKRAIAGAEPPDSWHGIHGAARMYQSFEEEQIEWIVKGLPPEDPKRQEIRRGLRWAKHATTIEVMGAIRETLEKAD